MSRQAISTVSRRVKCLSYSAHRLSNYFLYRWTQNGKYSDGVRTQGGYSNMIIANERFVFPIPDEIESKYAASMLCAGLTVYAPLKRHGTGPGKKVGIVGIGGLVLSSRL